MTRIETITITRPPRSAADVPDTPTLDVGVARTEVGERGSSATARRLADFISAKRAREEETRSGRRRDGHDGIRMDFDPPIPTSEFLVATTERQTRPSRREVDREKFARVRIALARHRIEHSTDFMGTVAEVIAGYPSYADMGMLLDEIMSVGEKKVAHVAPQSRARALVRLRRKLEKLAHARADAADGEDSLHTRAETLAWTRRKEDETATAAIVRYALLCARERKIDASALRFLDEIAEIANVDRDEILDGWTILGV